jgi:hypothetical protein
MSKFKDFSQINGWLAEKFLPAGREVVSGFITRATQLRSSISSLAQNYAAAYSSVQKYVYSDDEYTDLTTDALASVPESLVSAVKSQIKALAELSQKQLSGIEVDGNPIISSIIHVGDVTFDVDNPGLSPDGSFPSITMARGPSGVPNDVNVNWSHGPWQPVPGHIVNYGFGMTTSYTGTGPFESKLEHIGWFIIIDGTNWFMEYLHEGDGLDGEYKPSGVWQSVASLPVPTSGSGYVLSREFNDGDSYNLKVEPPVNAPFRTALTVLWPTYQPEAVYSDAKDIVQVLWEQWSADLSELEDLL